MNAGENDESSADPSSDSSDSRRGRKRTKSTAGTDKNKKKKRKATSTRGKQRGSEKASERRDRSSTATMMSSAYTTWKKTPVHASIRSMIQYLNLQCNDELRAFQNFVTH